MTLPTEEVRVLRALERKFPMFVAAHVLQLSVPQVSYRRKLLLAEDRKRKRRPQRGGVRGNTFVYDFNADEYASIGEPYMSRLREIHNFTLRKESIKPCRLPVHDGDLCPADAIRLYRHLAPATLFQRLFGLSEKAFARIAKAVGKALEAPQALRVNAAFLRSDFFPEMPRLSNTQQQRLRHVTSELRRAAENRGKKAVEMHAKELLQRMHSAASCSDQPLVPCRGKYCESQWPRTEEFFYATTDTADGLQTHCKYCCYRVASLRRQRRDIAVRPRKTRTLRPAEVKRLSHQLRLLYGKVPALYLKQVFNLSSKQYSSLLNRVKGNVTECSTHSLLCRWRNLEDIPSFPNLSNADLEQLRLVWQRDKAEWEQELAENDQTLLLIMKEQFDALKSSKSKEDRDVINRGTRECQGGCANKWWQTQFFFPLRQGRYRNWCRHCFNREHRKKG